MNFFWINEAYILFQKFSWVRNILVICNKQDCYKKCPVAVSKHDFEIYDKPIFKTYYYTRYTTSISSSDYSKDDRKIIIFFKKKCLEKQMNKKTILNICQNIYQRKFDTKSSDDENGVSNKLKWILIFLPLHKKMQVLIDIFLFAICDIKMVFLFWYRDS